MVRVKICGMTNREDALMAVNAGADAIGAITIKQSPRSVELDVMKEIFRCLPIFVSKVVVANPKSLDEAVEISETADYLQLHGDESLDFVKGLKGCVDVPIIKKIVVDEDGMKEAKRYSKLIDAILLDTKSKLLGGTGMTHDWSLSEKIASSINKPVILAGGLNPGNVRDAIEKVKPYAVDVSSGVESKPGKKDEMKVRKFIMNAKSDE